MATALNFLFLKLSCAKKGAESICFIIFVEVKQLELKDMKKLFIMVLALAGSLSMAVQASSTPDLTDLLKGIGGSSSGSSSSDIVSGLGSVLNGVLSTSKLSVSDVAGNWVYSAPAVEFKSENLLKKAGGAAASSTITNKIKPYYEKAGLNNMQLTINTDNTFTMKVGKVSSSGTIETTDENGVFLFAFKAMGKISLGKVTTYMSKNISGQLTVTFDASKLITVVNGIANLSSNSTLQGVSSLLNSYDGLTVGFVLNKN